MAEMRQEFHVAVPRQTRPVGIAGRQAPDARIGEGHRLDGDRRRSRRNRGGTDQGAAEGQHPGRVAGGSLGEQHHHVAVADTAGDRLGGAGGLGAPGAVDEDRALQARQRPEHGPAGDFRLGDEGDRQDAAEKGDVEPGEVIGGDQQRRLRRRPDHLDAEADHPPGDPLPIPGQPRRQRPAAPRRQDLQRHEQERHGAEDDDDRAEAQGAHQPLSFSRSGPGAGAPASSGTP